MRIKTVHFPADSTLKAIFFFFVLMMPYVLHPQAYSPSTIPFKTTMVALLKTAPGWKVTIAATGLPKPRMLYSAEGIVYVTCRNGEVIMIADKDYDGLSESVRTVVNFKGVHGITVKDGWMYLCNSSELRRYRMNSDGTVKETYQTLITGLPDAGQHPNRTIDFGPDGMLYMSIGSTCNDCIEAKEMATIEQIDPHTWKRTIYAAGLRNTIGFDWHPATRELWGCDNGGDGKGEDWPPEEVNHIVKNGHYGYPYLYGKNIVDEGHKDPPGDTRENLAKRAKPSVLDLQAHMAPIQFCFFGNDATIPVTYRGNALVCFHGSWNRSTPVGYKVMRIKFKNGVAVSADDFLWGFLMSGNQKRFGRPAGVTINSRGVVYISDDANGVIYSIRFSQ
jgi:glucose/arabinose dehydrogenase